MAILCLIVAAIAIGLTIAQLLGVGPQRPEAPGVVTVSLLMLLGVLSGLGYAACFNAPPPELGP